MAKEKSEMFVKIARSIEDSFLWNAVGIDHFDVRSAWVDLIIQANHKQGDFVCGANHIVVKRGQFITSIYNLSHRWNCSRQTTRKYLDLFEREGMIYRESNNRFTTITLVNYGKYQDSVPTRLPRSCRQDDQQVSDSETTELPSDFTQSNNVKNDKELKKNVKNKNSDLGDF